MRTRNCKGIFHNILYIGLIFLGTLLLDSCAKKITFANSSVVPAAEGLVKIKKDKNKNYHIELSVMRLAEPDRLFPSAHLYLVWMETEGYGTKNIGRLKTSRSLFSKSLKSSLNTVSSFKPIKIFITAEDDGNIQYPGGQTVLSTEHF